MGGAPSLNVVSEAAKNPLPVPNYDGSYNFANVLLILPGHC